MRQRMLTELNGITYMSPKAAGDKWNMSPQKVTAACKDARVVGAIKDSGNRWIIPIDSPCPLEKEQIRTALIAVLAAKNWPGTRLPGGTDLLFDYLRAIDLLEGTDTLTDKGMQLATAGKSASIDWKNAGATILSVIGSLASIWSVIPK